MSPRKQEQRNGSKLMTIGAHMPAFNSRPKALMQYQTLNHNDVVIGLCLVNIVSANICSAQQMPCPLSPTDLERMLGLGLTRHYLMVSQKSTLKGGWTVFRRYVDVVLYLTYSGVMPPYIFCDEISR